MPQLIPLIDKIKEKLAPFNSQDSIINGFHVVKLCLDYGWIQQAYTVLIETTVSYILNFENLDWQEEKYRNILNSCFVILKGRIQEEAWKGDAFEEKSITKTLLNCNLVKILQNDFIDLIACRNDINHAGIRQNPMSAKTLQNKIEKIYCNIVVKIL